MVEFSPQPGERRIGNGLPELSTKCASQFHQLHPSFPVIHRHDFHRALEVGEHLLEVLEGGLLNLPCQLGLFRVERQTLRVHDGMPEAAS